MPGDSDFLESFGFAFHLFLLNDPQRFFYNERISHADHTAINWPDCEHRQRAIHQNISNCDNTVLLFTVSAADTRLGDLGGGASNWFSAPRQ